MGEWGCFDRTRFGMFAFAADGASSQARVRTIEEDGFDVVWAADHLFHYQMPDAPFLDGWMCLAAWTQVTTTYSQAALVPGPVQRPRPPLVLAGNGPRALAAVARHGDVWNTWSGDARSLAGLHDQVRRRVDVLRREVDAQGRDPAGLRLSLTVYHRAVDVWGDVASLEQVVAQFRPLGFSEFVLYPPRDGQQLVYERVTQSRMPDLR